MHDKELQNNRWRSARHIGIELETAEDADEIAQAAALSLFVQSALPARAHKAAPIWEAIVKLSPAGEEAIRISGLSKDGDASRPDIHFALFCMFYHHELLINPAACDLVAIRKAINGDLMSRNLVCPHRFGRLLYDRFNDSHFRDTTDHLLPDEALELIDGTPQGVYQLKQMVSGPLGLLDSQCDRHIPPSRRLVLWHCSDPGCRKAHLVELLRIEVPFVRIIREVRKALNAQLGPCSEWYSPLTELIGRQIPRKPYSYLDVCVLIADAIVGDERSSLLVSALKSPNGNRLRKHLSSARSDKTSGHGSPEAIVRALDDEQMLQLLFTLDDSELVQIIDREIRNGSIRIPLGEKRRARMIPSPPWRASTSEISALGIRCSGEEPLLDLCALLWDAYSSSNILSELNWRLRNRIGSGTQSTLLDYLSKNDPAASVKELVLSSEPVTRNVCEAIGCPLEESGEPGFTDKLVWKLGFNLPRFSDSLATIKRRLGLFNQELLAVGSPRGEADRERIRGAGVNLFVSVESFLEQLVSFNVWVLASDHFLSTRFRYDASAARRKVSDVLGPSISSSGIETRWNCESGNTLGCLMVYLNSAATWMKGLPGCERDSLIRPESDLPDYADDSFRIFPFRHTTLWADSDLACLEALATKFSDVVAMVSRSNLAAIRNGLDHQRDAAGFPKIDEMLAFVAHFREAVDTADVHRFFPKEFWLEKSHEDRFGRCEYVFRDYQGRSHVTFGPSFVRGIPVVSHEAPTIIAPGNLLGFANSEILLKSQDRSVYSEYWEGYPRRRRIPNERTQSNAVSELT